MTSDQIKQLEEEAARRQREADARKGLASATEDKYEAIENNRFARQTGHVNAERERFKRYRADALEERMSNINRHPENYNPLERRSAAKYAADQEARRQFDAQDATRIQESQDKREGMVNQGRGAIEAKAEADKNDFERKYGFGGSSNYLAEQAAARQAEIEKAKLAGVEAARAQAEGTVGAAKVSAESNEKIGASRDAAAVRVAEEQRKGTEASAKITADTAAANRLTEIEKARLSAQSRLAAVMARPITDDESIQIARMKKDPRYKGVTDDQLLAVLRRSAMGDVK